MSEKGAFTEQPRVYLSWEMNPLDGPVNSNETLVWHPYIVNDARETKLYLCPHYHSEQDDGSAFDEGNSRLLNTEIHKEAWTQNFVK